MFFKGEMITVNTGSIIVGLVGSVLRMVNVTQ